MTTTPEHPIHPLGDEAALDRAAARLLTPAAGATVEVVAVGEASHAEPAFRIMRGRLLPALARHGVRSVALETDALSALVLDDWAAGGPGELAGVLAAGFTHGLEALPGNEDLLRWLRAENAGRAAADRITVHGIDGPLEMTSAPSPGPHLARVLDYLAPVADAVVQLPAAGEVAALAGPEERWADEGAVLHAERSPGASADAAALRLIADDVLTALASHAPELIAASSPEAWRRAHLRARTARGLLRYHAAAARDLPPGPRMSAMLGVRDVLMAENLLAVRAHERDRGPTFVFANNLHLQRRPATMALGGAGTRWTPAGAIAAASLRGSYVFVAGAVGGDDVLVLADGDPAGADARLELRAVPPEPLTVEDVAALLTTLPGVPEQVVGEDDGLPDHVVGSRFYYAGGGRTMPFATIVPRDYPGSDEESRLDRDGAFRVNVPLTRDTFTGVFGFAPKDLDDHRAGIDFAAADRLLPHPVYGGQAWGCVVSPTQTSLQMLRALFEGARDRALKREERRARPAE